ncbi:MAG: substrate-binding domain-containing protein [Pseudobutyrivibrio sp.]|nr:substrate-binding domain-containing protein [Pseudobutyrivibrio sp.]
MKVNQKSKNLIVLLLTVVMALGMLLTGCGGSSSSGGGSSSAKIFYTAPPDDDFKALLKTALTENAQTEGVTLDIGEGCNSVNDQVQQIKQAASGGYDAIICLPVDRSTALQLEVSAGDIPLIFVNASPDEEYLEKDKYIVVSSYEMDAGAYQAEYVWNALGKPSSFNAVLLRGPVTHNAAIARSVSVYKYFKENGVDVNFVFDDSANWEEEQAKDMMAVVQKTGQSFDAVFCNNDSMAVGVADYLSSHGYDLSKIPVVGVDATAGGCQSIVDGKMQFTVYQSASGQGQKAIQCAKALATKGTAAGIEGLSDDGLYIWVPFEKVDSSNVKNYM